MAQDKQGKTAEESTSRAAQIQAWIAAIVSVVALAGPIVPLVNDSHHPPCTTRDAAIAKTLDEHPGLSNPLAHENDGYNAKCGTAASIVKAEESSPPPNSNLAKK